MPNTFRTNRSYLMRRVEMLLRTLSARLFCDSSEINGRHLDARKPLTKRIVVTFLSSALATSAAGAGAAVVAAVVAAAVTGAVSTAGVASAAGSTASVFAASGAGTASPFDVTTTAWAGTSSVGSVRNC